MTHFSICETTNDSGHIIPLGRLEGSSDWDKGVLPFDGNQFTLTVTHHRSNEALTFQSVTREAALIRKPLFVDFLLKQFVYDYIKNFHTLSNYYTS